MRQISKMDLLNQNEQSVERADSNERSTWICKILLRDL